MLVEYTYRCCLGAVVRIRVIALASALLVTALVVFALFTNGPAPIVTAVATPIQTPKTVTTSCVGIDRAPGWVARENAKKGSTTWRKKVISGFPGDGRIQTQIPLLTRLFRRLPPASGWFDRVSAQCGERVGLHISGRGKPIKVQLFRAGYYRGLGARLIWSTTTLAAPYRGDVNITPDPTHTISTSWPVSVTLDITSAFPPGEYLAKLIDSGSATFVPLTIRDDQSKAPILIMSSVLTAEAYNHWGGSSLYRGVTGGSQNRSRVVSFDRPYDGSGASQFLIHEFGLLKLAESLGLDLAYATDIDLTNNPEQVRQHKSILFGGHGEYWTTSMRNALELARSIGVNIASLGANAGYWRTRLENHDRSVAVWRDKSDPYVNSPTLRTNRWRDGILPRPESLLLGSQYAGLGVKCDYKVLDAKAWPFIGTGLTTNELIDGIVGKEVDSPEAGPGPAVQLLTSARVRIKKTKGSVLVGMTYYTTVKESGVIDAGSNGWTCAIDDACNWGHVPAKSSRSVAAVTRQILKALAAGPLGVAYPAITNVPAR